MTCTALESLDMTAVVAGHKRLSVPDAMVLYRHASLYDLGRWSTAVADRLHGSQVRTYVVDRNVNYTNVCSAHCTFCAFKRNLGDAQSYTLSRQQLHEKIRRLIDIGGTQVLLQGGMHPTLPISFYEEMLADLKATFPTIHLHAFSPPELVEFVAVFQIEGLPTTEPGQSHTLPDDIWQAKLQAIMRRLMAAGLDSIPGGGGEIFAAHVRRRIGIGKASADQWLSVMAAAHRLGMFTSATMMFGHIEGVADRLDHLNRIRQMQDQAIAQHWPGRYVSFIAWPFQRENTPLGRLPPWDEESAEPFPGDLLAEAVLTGQVDPTDKAACSQAAPLAGKRLRLASAVDYLRMQAIARLFLDNVPSIGASWVTMGPMIGQLGLSFGANDMGSVMMEENVVSAAGTTYCLNEALLCHLIRTAGYTPAKRDNRYRWLTLQQTPDSPDLCISDWSTQRSAACPSNPSPSTTAARSVTLPIRDKA